MSAGELGALVVAVGFLFYELRRGNWSGALGGAIFGLLVWYFIIHPLG